MCSGTAAPYNGASPPEAGAVPVTPRMEGACCNEGDHPWQANPEVAACSV